MESCFYIPAYWNAISLFIKRVKIINSGFYKCKEIPMTEKQT